MKIQNFSFTKMHLKISTVKWQPFCPGGDELTHWDWRKMCAIWRQNFQHDFLVCQLMHFLLNFYFFFPRVQLPKCQHCSENDLRSNKHQAFIWTNDDLVYMCHWASGSSSNLTRNLFVLAALCICMLWYTVWVIYSVLIYSDMLLKHCISLYRYVANHDNAVNW